MDRLPVPTVKRAIAAVVLPLALSAACGGAPPPSAAQPRPAAHVEPPPAPLPAWTYWEAVDVPVVEGAKAAEVPVDVAQLQRSVGADKRWAAAPRALREAVTAHGFAVTRVPHPESHLGDFYASLRDDRVAWVLTLDALFFVTHVALDRALADVDARLIAPALATMLHRLDLRLAAESRGAGADMAPSYVVAHGVVAVALALLQADYVAPEDMRALVDGEKSRVLTHVGIATSPWFGVPLDYSAMSPRGDAERDPAHAGWFRAVAWLQGAALALVGTGEGVVFSGVDVGTARVHARAALLLSRLLDYDVDAEAAAAWDRVARAGELLVGDADDASPRDLSLVAAAQKLDLRNGDWFSNVATVDHVRHAAAKAREAKQDDGTLGSIVARGGVDPLLPIGRLAPGFRLVGPRRTPDGELLQAVVFPSVGGFEGHEPPASARDGVRALPSALDVAAWLGSSEARAEVHAGNDDAYARYPETLDRLMHARPPEGSLERHRTPYLSMLDALETLVRPSAGDRVQPGADTAEGRARKAEVAVGAWTEIRHDATAMSRVEVLDLRLAPRTPVESPVPVFVEPHPEAIAKLVAVVRQMQRALVGSGMLAKGAPGLAMLDEVDDLLWTALGVAVHEASDSAVPPALVQQLAAFPARLRALEASLVGSGAAEVPLVVDVHTDRPSGRALEEGLGRLEELWTVMREPETHRLWLAVGAAIPHAEVVVPMAQRTSDDAWRAGVTGEGDFPPDPLEQKYLVKRE
ncbi:MAG TPA: DUF3160 domain-containing protein [Polyangiaceae bacterium]